VQQCPGCRIETINDALRVEQEAVGLSCGSHRRFAIDGGAENEPATIPAPEFERKHERGSSCRRSIEGHENTLQRRHDGSPLSGKR
jgi:hypothetical protein